MTVKIKVPKYAERKHSSRQALSAQRMPARVYKDRKKELSKKQCRGR